MVHKTKKVLKTIGVIITGILLLLALFILFGSRWVFKTWSDLSIEEVIYHIGAPLTGTNMDMIWDYVFWGVVPVVVMVALMAIVLYLKREKRYFGKLLAIIAAVSLAILGGDVVYAAHRLNIVRFLQAESETSAFVDTYYVDPATAELEFPEEKRNLIYIFLESMETTYQGKQSGGVFTENMIPELTRLAQENEDFSGDTTCQSGAYALPWTTWTVAAMFAEVSGLPLHISIEDNSMDTQEHFFPSITTIGDILEANGYNQTLLIGSSAGFAGRNILFTEHGNYEIRDYDYAKAQGWIPEDYYVWWGYEDEYLFQFAKETLQELASGDQPFNLTMLTVDTHFEDGYECELCESRFGDNRYANVLACSSRQVMEFVSWIQKQDYYENTTIVLCGDHPTMDGDFLSDIPEDYERTVYTVVINPACEKELTQKREFSTFDLFPTTLAAMGVEIQGDRLGLGTNLFSSTETLLERFDYEYVSEELYKNSELITRLAEIDETTEAWRERAVVLYGTEE